MDKRLNKDLIEKMYKNGLSANQIATALSLNKNSVKSCISRNFSHLVDVHEENKKVRRSFFRAIRREDKQWISDRSLIKFYRQSYITDAEGNLVYDKKTRGRATNDLPKKLIVT